MCIRDRIETIDISRCPDISFTFEFKGQKVAVVEVYPEESVIVGFRKVGENASNIATNCKFEPVSQQALEAYHNKKNAERQRHLASMTQFQSILSSQGIMSSQVANSDMSTSQDISKANSEVVDTKLSELAQKQGKRYQREFEGEKVDIIVYEVLLPNGGAYLLFENSTEDKFLKEVIDFDLEGLELDGNLTNPVQINLKPNSTYGIRLRKTKHSSVFRLSLIHI
eukprot:TRINITY_DN4225_c0_g1_i4.p1 TRINITY_DN4225_c0_g1~~TRINITY_DN4225_c0_g1_i4.p1  ORF type:complete len:225 (+),score=34.22 TRINITY_DN4225_c0_g1_i4:66-740(+)